MLKFKIGDKVKVKEDLKIGEYYNGLIFNSGKEAYKGKIITIQEIHYGESVSYIDEEDYYWTDEMLEPVEIIKEDEKPEMVNHPQHYAFKYEPIDVINDWGLDFNLGNTVKYIARCERKGNKIQDLEKAKFYLEDEIRRLKENGIK